ncbi:hypothetical protein QTP88_009176 [Uroleucon formosanum]
MDSQSQEESSGKMEHKMWKQYLRIGSSNRIFFVLKFNVGHIYSYTQVDYWFVRMNRLLLQHYEDRLFIHPFKHIIIVCNCIDQTTVGEVMQKTVLHQSLIKTSKKRHLKIDMKLPIKTQ